MQPPRRRRCKGGCGRELYGPASRCQACAPAAKAARLACRIERPPAPRARPEPDPNRNPEHLDWIRRRPCVIAGCMCLTGSQAAHVRVGTGGGMGLKPPDRYVIPLCYPHHAEQHQIGERSFEAKYQIDMRAVADECAALSPHLK